MSTDEHRGARVVFTVLGGPLAVLLIAVTAFAITGTLGRQTESSPLAFAEPVTKVRIGMTNGSVTLRGGVGTSVTGERVLTRGIQAPAYSERVEGDTLVIEAHCFPLGNTWCDVSYVLDLPASVEVEVETAVGGIRAFDLTGPLHLRSATGAVSVEDVSGTLQLESGAGSVRGTGIGSDEVRAFAGAGSVDLAFAGAPTFVEAATGAGSVDVEVPRDGSTYRIEESPEGDPSIRVAVSTEPTSNRVLKLESGAGGVSVHYPEA